MSYTTNDDNIYQVGTIISAKVNPSLKLLITKYYQRIYYCSIIGQEKEKQLVYFEKELIPPSQSM